MLAHVPARGWVWVYVFLTSKCRQASCGATGARGRAAQREDSGEGSGSLADGGSKNGSVYASIRGRRPAAAEGTCTC